MVLPPSRLARGGPPNRWAAVPPAPFSPWQAAHFCLKIGAPCAEVPLPGGRPVPSGMMEMSQAARSEGLTGLPRLGPSAKAAPAARANASETVLSESLRIDMLDLPFGVDRPAGDGIEVLARERQDRWRLRGLTARGHELRPGRLRVAGFIPGAALQDGGTAVPAPRHAEAGEGLGQHRVLQGRLRP